MMKFLRFDFKLSLIVLLGLLTVACSDDDNDVSTVITDPLETNHFDIWVSAGESSGMGSGTPLVYGTKSLDKQDTIDFRGVGVDVAAKLYQESIIKGQYYYQIPKEKDRIGKYRIGTKGIEVVKEISFGVNTYKDRRYTHAWLDNNTFVIMAANGDATKIIWTKIDADNMKILAEGELVFPESATQIAKFSTSGIAGYRASDNKILYSYLDNKDKTRFYMAFINASDMSVDKIVMEDRAEMMAGTAYGELLQSKSFFDTSGNYYLACSNVIPGAPSTTQQYSTLLRINRGETEFDQNYIGYRNTTNSKGKIITAEFLAPGKALLYIMDPEHTGATGWGASYNCYYAILDLNTDAITELDVPYSEGNFSQRSVVLGTKAYIGANPKSGNPCVYVYDINTGKITKGLTIKEGFSFDRIVAILD